jgi:hypothetical protein
MLTADQSERVGGRGPRNCTSEQSGFSRRILPRLQEHGNCCHTQDDEHPRPAKHNLTIILEASKAQLDHHERGITLGKSTIDTLLTIQHMSCSQQSTTIAMEQVNNPAVALPFSVMLWRDLCRYDGTGTLDDTRRKRGLSGTRELAST